MYKKADQLQNMELRINGLTDRAIKIGALQERKRAADIVLDEYAVWFPVNTDIAKLLHDLAEKIMKDD